MKRYPVAGQLLEQPLLFGLSVRDLEVAVIPVILLSLASGINQALPGTIPGVFPLAALALGIALAVYVLWRTPAGQYPREWVIALLRYHLGPTRYLWASVEPAHATGRYQDELRSVPDDTSHPNTNTESSLTESRAPTGVNSSPDSTLDDGSDQDGESTDDRRLLSDGGRPSRSPDHDQTASNSRERSQPDAAAFAHRLTRDSTLTQDTLAFDYVRDDGVIVIEGSDEQKAGQAYVGLVDVSPTSWLALDSQRKQAIIDQFGDILLGTVSYPIQILALPREFDLSQHVNKITEAGITDRDAPVLLNLGRLKYQDWIHETLSTQRIKVRDYYIAIRVEHDHVASAIPRGTAATRSRIGRFITRFVSLGGWLRGFASGSGASSPDEVETQCLKEVRTRQTELANALTQNTAVSAEPVTDRTPVMDILYRYYNHAESPLDEYSSAAYSRVLPEVDQADGTDTDTE